MNRNCLDPVLIELQLASRFLELAEATDNPERRVRSLANAQVACSCAQDILATVQCSDEQRISTGISLTSIQERLDAEARFPLTPSESNLTPLSSAGNTRRLQIRR